MRQERFTTPGPTTLEIRVPAGEVAIDEQLDHRVVATRRRDRDLRRRQCVVRTTRACDHQRRDEPSFSDNPHRSRIVRAYDDVVQPSSSA